MQYNECEICGANNGRAGLLLKTQNTKNLAACLNCHDTINTGSLVLYSNLNRTKEEIQKTIDIFKNNSFSSL